jgi:hypothetical protein
MVRFYSHICKGSDETEDRIICKLHPSSSGIAYHFPEAYVGRLWAQAQSEEIRYRICLRE